MPKQATVGSFTSCFLSLTPLLASIVAFFIYGLMYVNFLYCADNSPQCRLINLQSVFRDIRPETGMSVAGYLDRVTWTLAGGLHLLVSLAAILVSGLVIYHALNGYRARVRWMLILIALIVAADMGLITALLTAADASSPARLILARTVARVMIDIDFYNRLFDALGITVGMMLTFAACALIWRDKGETQGEAELKRRLRLLRALLYAGAAALIIGVLRLAAALNWGGGFWASGSASGREASALINGIISSLGISYTLILVSMYLPTVLILNARVESLAHAVAPENPKEWLDKRGLILSYRGYLPRLLALLGPVLIGPFGQLLNALIKMTTGE
ncbi:MAG TPA: hypothetical protein VGW12_05765 [Pyrinomonadaceae bacterium]|nr:hypothetical protein [Pyrinomonadaceae bacterium]